MLNFDFLKKGVELAFPPYFVHDFSRKIFFMLYPISWPNFIVWLPLRLEAFGNMCIVNIYFPVCDVIKFKVNLSYQAIFLSDQKSREQKFKYLKNEKSF